MSGPIRFMGIEGCWSPIQGREPYSPLGQGAAVLADDDSVINPTTGMSIAASATRSHDDILHKLADESLITRTIGGPLVSREDASRPLYAVLVPQRTVAVIGAFMLTETPNDDALCITNVSLRAPDGERILAELCIFTSFAAKQAWGRRVIPETLIPAIFREPHPTLRRELLSLGFALSDSDPWIAALRVRNRPEGVSLERSIQIHRHWATNKSDPWTTDDCATFDRIVAGGPIQIA